MGTGDSAQAVARILTEVQTLCRTSFVAPVSLAAMTRQMIQIGDRYRLHFGDTGFVYVFDLKGISRRDVLRVAVLKATLDSELFACLEDAIQLCNETLWLYAIDRGRVGIMFMGARNPRREGLLGLDLHINTGAIVFQEAGHGSDSGRS